MDHLILLETSSFNLNPPSGKVVYKRPAGKPVEEDLVPSNEVSSSIPYPLLNPLQSLFFKFYKGGTALVCAPTSAGKSLTAYIFLKEKEGRKVFCAPTKSLVYEKAKELRKLFRKKVDVRTGDLFDVIRGVRSEIVVSTYENLSLALRNRAPWTEEIGGVVIDEIHSLVNSRGWVVEEIIALLRERGIEILGLSATMPGANELAKWIEADLFIESRWRPVPLERKIIPLTKFPYDKSLEDREDRMASRLLSALYELTERDQQVILFVHKKSIGWRLLEIADREKIPVFNETVPFEKQTEGEPEIAFHNADIPKEEREAIENAFREGKLKNLVATSTLAYGVNLPADVVIVSVRGFYDKLRREFKTFPDVLDILQMEGRAGRLGIKDKGFSYILPFGAKEGTLRSSMRVVLEEEFEPYLAKQIKGNLSEEEVKRVLSLFLLIGVLYEGSNFKRFLDRTYSLRGKVDEVLLEEVLEWLEERGYLENFKLSDKALMCVRSGISPVNYEEFLRRRSILSDHAAIIRPLLFTKRFDSLYDFLRRSPEFPADLNYVRNKLLPCGDLCLKDNTDQLIFYVEGLTFKYPNLKNPPGEFSYLGSDALHLLRNLLSIREFGDIAWDDRTLITIAHSLKFGISHEFSPIGGIKGIGHIRANLLRRLLHEFSLSSPPLGSPVEDLIELIKGEIPNPIEAMAQILSEYRSEDPKKSLEEAKKVWNTLQKNSKGFLVDERILRAFASLKIGPEAIRLPKRELVDMFLLK